MLGGSGGTALSNSRGRHICHRLGTQCTWAVHSLFDHTQQFQMVISGTVVVVVASCYIYFS